MGEETVDDVTHPEEAWFVIHFLSGGSLSVGKLLGKLPYALFSSLSDTEHQI